MGKRNFKISEYLSKAEQAVLLLQLMVVAVCLVLCFLPKETITLSGANIFMTEEGGYRSEPIALKAGTYQVRVSYETDVDFNNYLTVSDDSLTGRELQCNGGSLFAGLDETDFEMWLYRNAGGVYVTALWCGYGGLDVTGVSFEETNAMARMRLFLVLLFFVVIDVIAKSGIWRNRSLATAFAVLCVFCLVPVMNDSILSSGDIGYHLMRIEGIRDGILAGQFPVRISPEWVQGHGYASPLFYGETLLYIGGILRIIGFTVTDSYRMMMGFIWLIGVSIAFSCYRKLFQSDEKGLVAAALNVLTVFAAVNMYDIGTIGAAMSILIAPLIVYGFYRVYTENTDAAEYKTAWMPLAAGFALILQTHMLSVELIGVFTIVLCLILARRTFQKRRFFALCKGAAGALLLSAWFVVPFVSSLLTGDFVVEHISGRLIQYRGLTPDYLLMGWVEKGSTITGETGTMVDAQAITLGAVGIIVLVCFWVILIVKGIKALLLFRENRGKTIAKEVRSRGDNRRTTMPVLGVILAGFSTAAYIMSLNSFPWDAIQSMGGIAATLVSSLQFPYRILSIVNICIGPLAVVVWEELHHSGRKNLQWLYMAAVVLSMLMGIVYFRDTQWQKTNTVRIYNNEGMGTGYVSGGEYLLYGSIDTTFVYHDPITSSMVSCSDMERGSLQRSCYVKNAGDTPGTIVFDLMGYPNYKAKDAETGETFVCGISESYELLVQIPAFYSGKLIVEYRSPWYWRLAELISLLALTGCGIYYYRVTLQLRTALHGE